MKKFSSLILCCVLTMNFIGQAMNEQRIPEQHELPNKEVCNTFKKEHAEILQKFNISDEFLAEIVGAFEPDLIGPDKQAKKIFKKSFAAATFKLTPVKGDVLCSAIQRTSQDKFNSLSSNDTQELFLEHPGLQFLTSHRMIHCIESLKIMRANSGLQGHKKIISIDTFPCFALSPDSIKKSVIVDHVLDHVIDRVIKEKLSSTANYSMLIDQSIISLLANFKISAKTLGVNWINMNKDTRKIYKESENKIYEIGKNLCEFSTELENLENADWANLEDITICVSACKPKGTLKAGELTAHAVVNVRQKPLNNGIDRKIMNRLREEFGVKTTGIVLQDATKATHNKMRNLILNQEALASLQYKKAQTTDEFVPVNRRKLIKDIEASNIIKYATNGEVQSLEAYTLKEVKTLNDSRNSEACYLSYDVKKDLISANTKAVAAQVGQAIFDHNAQHVLSQNSSKK